MARSHSHLAVVGDDGFSTALGGHIPLTSRILTTPKDHEAFANAFESVGGNSVPIEYLRRSKARGFFRGDRLIAGYVLNCSAPFRYATWIPPVVREEIQGRGFLTESTTAELTCIWMGKKKLTKLERNRVYVQSVVDAFRSAKPLVLGGSRIAAVARIQKRALPRSLYEGEATFGGICEIYYASRHSMLARFLSAAAVTYGQDICRLISRCPLPIVRAAGMLRRRRL